MFIRTAGPDANSCAGCHNQPVSGGAGDFVANVFVSTPSGEPVSASVDPSFTTERGTPSMNGSGLIELLAREMTLELNREKISAVREATERNKEVLVNLVAKGVSFGHITALPDGNLSLARVVGIDKDLIVRPFSQKGTISSLRAFTVNALNQHHGMQATERFGILQSGDDDFDGDGVVNELTQGDVTAMVVYQATLPVPGRLLPADPARRARIDHGEGIFGKIGCAGCHVPTMIISEPTFYEPGQFNLEGTLRQRDALATFRFDVRTDGPKPHPEVHNDGAVVVRAYTDFKRHRICDAERPQYCNETLIQGFVPIDQFITKRLWDVGNTAPYGHRGDLTSLREAILAHGGEARESRLLFQALPRSEQAAVVEFLKSMQILPEGSELTQVAPSDEQLPYAREAEPGDIEE